MKAFHNSIGYGFENADVQAFFAHASGTRESLQKNFPDYEFRQVKQTHSDIFTQSAPLITEADAHYTNLKKVALLIKTADCMPIMIYCRQTRRIAAVHAGWRGVENKITLKMLNHFIVTGSSEKKFDIFIGPSIQQKSFEIDTDVYLKLVAADPVTAQPEMVFQKNSKFYVDLQKIVCAQINQVCDNRARLWTTDIDTKTNLSYYSYRRDQNTVDRNYSYICLLT